MILQVNLPPVDLRAVCLVRAIGESEIQRQKADECGNGEERG